MQSVESCVLKVHGCGRSCRDALAAAAVLSGRAPEDAALSAAPRTCPQIDRAEWALLRSAAGPAGKATA